MVAILLLFAAYVLGSIPTGLWLGVRLRGIDIREHGSKNIGATNTLRVLGKKLGALALLGDMAKGLVPVVLAKAYVGDASGVVAALPVACGLAAILGHSFSLFLRFTGGKGVATSTGVFLALLPLPTFVGFCVFAGVVAATQMVSAGSMSAALAIGIMVFLAPVPWPLRMVTAAVAVLVIYKHRSNLGRILRGNESRMWVEALPVPQNGIYPLVRADWVLAAVLAMGAFLVYCATVAPTVTGEDSGELITAAWGLGIPHPPAYPLWCLLAHPFTWLPWGTVAWRVNLASGAFGAGAVLFVAALGIMLTRNRLAAVTAALAFAFSREFWEQSLIAEVYSLNALCIAGCLFVLLQWRMRRSDAWLRALAVVYGLSLANHNSMIVAGPVFALYILGVERSCRWRRYGFYAACCVIALGCMFLVELYLPIRSLANPAMDWGNPETVSNFWDVVRRKQYAFMYSQYPRDAWRFISQCGAFAWFLPREFTSLVSLAGVAGLVVLFRRALGPFLLIVGTGGAIVLAAIHIQNFNSDKEWLWVMSVFAIPLWMAVALGIGEAVRATQARYGVRAAMVLALLCILLPLGANGNHNNRSESYIVDDYARNLLESLEPDAILVTEYDHASFPAIYLQNVEKVRPDVSLARKYGYVDMGLVPDLPEEKRLEWGPFPKRRYEPEYFAFLIAHTARPVYFQVPPRLPSGSDVTFAPAGLLYRAVRTGETMPAREYWTGYRWRDRGRDDSRGDYTSELIRLEIAWAQARDSFAAGMPEEALVEIEAGLAVFGRDAIMLNNAGVVCARNGQKDVARQYFEEALEEDPTLEAARGNLKKLGE